MSFATKHFEFMQPTLTALDLELPVVMSDDDDGQYYDFKAGDRFLVFTYDRQRYSEVKFKEVLQLSLSTRKLLIFSRLENNEQISLSNAAIARLEKEGRIVPVDSDGRRHLPGSSLRLSEAIRRLAEKAMYCVDKLYERRESLRVTHLSKRLTREFLSELAESRGEKVMSYEWLMKMVRADAQGSRFDRLMNFARKPARGNESRRKGPLVYEALELAARHAWSRPNGTYRTMQDHFQWLIENEPRFAPARKEVMDKNGVVTLAKSTFDFHLASVDYYTRDLLRYGPEQAARRNRQYVRVHRPQSILDVMDVDHLTTDIFAYHDSNPLAFGRLDLVVFRDRASGILAGYGIGFGSPSYATFLRGLEHTIFQKDKETLAEGVAFPWFGLPKRLGVDNALHFIGHSIEATAAALGIQLIEHRPGTPGDKGALERALGTMQRDVFHGLPGTTMSAPDIRKLFGERHDVGVPVLALSEVETVLQYWISRVHHKTPREGLGGDLLTEAGVPEEIWAAQLKNAPPRPLLDRTMFARMAGERRRVTIQKDGVRADGIHYASPELLSLYLHPDTRRAKSGRASTRFQLTLNINDLGQAWVHDPYRDVMIEVKAVGPDAKYCENMTLEIHRMLQKFRREKRRSRERCPTLMEARQHFHQTIMDLIGKARKKHDPRRMLARFLGGQMQASRRRQVVELAKMREDRTIDLSSGVRANETDPVVHVPDDFDATTVPGGEDEPARTTVKPKASRMARRRKQDSKPSIQARSIEDIAAQRPEWDD